MLLFVIGFGPFSLRANGRDSNTTVTKSEGMRTYATIFEELNLKVISRRPNAIIVVNMRNNRLDKNYTSNRISLFDN